MDIWICLLVDAPHRGIMDEVPRSYLLQNDKTGKFKDVTALYAKELAHTGFVTQACLV